MITINSQEDFLRSLSENPEWKAEVRAQILGEELLQLPARFDAFAGQMAEFTAEMKGFVARQEQTNVEMKGFVSEMKDFVARQEQHNAEQKLTNTRIWTDLGRLKGHYAREVTLRKAESITLLMGLEYIRTVPGGELTRMALKMAQGQVLSNELRSFQDADMIVEASDGDTVQYIAVEASFTADLRDTNRALRNARFLAEFTGQPSRAAIASVKNDDSINWQMASGDVYWHEIEERDMEPE